MAGRNDVDGGRAEARAAVDFAAKLKPGEQACQHCRAAVATTFPRGPERVAFCVTCWPLVAARFDVDVTTVEGAPPVAPMNRPTPGFVQVAMEHLAARGEMFSIAATHGPTGVLWGVWLGSRALAHGQGTLVAALETALRAVEREG